MTVAVTGASGLIGSAFVPFLTSGGHDVRRLVRRAPGRDDEIPWDPARDEIDAASLEGVDAVVHLSGESVAGGRWTDARKARIRESRIESTRTLARALASLKRPPKVLVSASAIGYYGDRGREWVTEESAAADDFLARLAVDWEAAAAPAAEAGIRVAHPRIGLVLSPAGGALGKLLLPFRLGLGGVVGPGTQYVSWVAIDDAIGALHLPGGLFVCGDRRDTASLHGALLSGRRAAEAGKASLGRAGVPDLTEDVEADPVDAGAGGMPRSVAEVV